MCEAKSPKASRRFAQIECLQMFADKCAMLKNNSPTKIKCIDLREPAILICENLREMN